ncbi:MAG TPA: hypothetical protein ENL13_01400 [Thermoplasmatales archaeon]|nr:hypothetical protein [Thermoplasmatales archaeon]
MKKKQKSWRLTEGSKYKIYSLGAKDTLLETVGIFKGFASLGLDEIGLCMEREKRKKGALRIIPLHSILAIDVLSENKVKEEEEEQEDTHYYG